MGTPITREGGYFIRAGRKAKGYRVDEETYKKFEKQRIFLGVILGLLIAAIMLGQVFFPPTFYTASNVFSQVGILGAVLLFITYMFCNVVWHFEEIFVRKLKAVDDGIPFRQRRYERFNRYHSKKSSLWIFGIAGAANIYIFVNDISKSLNLFAAILCLLLVVEYTYYHFSHGKGKKKAEG